MLVRLCCSILSLGLCFSCAPDPVTLKRAREKQKAEEIEQLKNIKGNVVSDEEQVEWDQLMAGMEEEQSHTLEFHLLKAAPSLFAVYKEGRISLAVFVP